MGVRLIEDFLSRTAAPRCLDMRETADKIQQAFRMYLNVQPTVGNWTSANDEFSLIFDNNPLAEFVELPSDITALRYSGILCGCIRGALEMVQLEVQSWFVQVSCCGFLIWNKKRILMTLGFHIYNCLLMHIYLILGSTQG